MMARRFCKRVLDRATDSRGLGVRTDISLSILSSNERILADPRRMQYERISELFRLSSEQLSRKTELDSEVQTFERETSSTKKILKPSEDVIMRGGRGHASSRALLGSVQRIYLLRERRIVNESSWSAHGLSMGDFNPESLLRWFHSTGEHFWGTVATAEEEQVAPDHQDIDKRADELRFSLTEPLGPFQLDLPKIENPTTELINRVFYMLDVQKWGPETVKELEDADVTFTPFLIQQIVQRMSSKNVDLTWNFFKWAREKAGRKLSLSSHIVILDAVGRSKDFEIMKHVFTLVVEDGHRNNSWPYNNAIKWCSAYEDVEAGLYFWSKMKESNCKPTVVTYTRLIDLLARQGHHLEALKIFRQMLHASCPPNIGTYNVLIHAFGIAGKLEVALSLFDKLSELGCKPNYSTYNTLVCLLVEAGKPEESLKYFNIMKAAGMVIGDDVYRTVHTALHKAKIQVVASPDNSGSSGKGDNPQQSASHLAIDFSLPGRIINPNTLIRLLEKGEPLSVEAKLEKIKPAIHSRFVVKVLQRLKNPDTAMVFFNWAKVQPHFKHDEYTFCMMINILGRSRNSEWLDRIMKEMQDQGIRMNTPIFSALITSYGRAKSMEGALKLFEQMKEWGCKPDIITYTSLIHLLAKHGSYEQALKMFEEMQLAGIAPNARTYSVMIYNLVKTGKVTEAISLLKEMPGLGSQPSPITFAKIIDHCAKEEQLETAKSLYFQMEEQGIKPLRTTITVLDGAYRKAGMIQDADKLVEKFRHRRIWDETFKSSTEKVANELLFKDLVKDESECKGVLSKMLASEK